MTFDQIFYSKRIQFKIILKRKNRILDLDRVRVCFHIILFTFSDSLLCRSDVSENIIVAIILVNTALWVVSRYLAAGLLLLLILEVAFVA